MTMLIVTALISAMMITITTPLMMAIIITILTAIITLVSSTFLASSWLSFILMMIFITGMMIIFVYISALTTNVNHFTESMPFNVLPFVLIYVTTLWVTPHSIFNNYNNINTAFTSNTSSMVYKLFSPETSLITALMMIYLLIALFVVIKNTSNNNHPMQLKK